MDTSCCVLGIGSPFGDDRLGWVAAEMLRGRDGGHAVRIDTLDRPGAALIEAWRDERVVILIDAVRSGAPPGTVHRIGIEGLTAGGAALSSHALGVAGAVTLARALAALPAELSFYGIEADPNWDGEDLSPPVRAALPALIEEIAELTRGTVQATPSTRGASK
ncbi:MAG TPA: hydrogenase maturation protease [Acidiferrobacterales bacterium]